MKKEKNYRTNTSNENKITEIGGIHDDMTDNGTADTACQRYFESQLDSGKVRYVDEELQPGIYRRRFYIVKE
ncbi:MAG: hypothetical protein PVJ52_00930 [Candidatus Woesebacteria bacterium]|jgi:hypothetical protein